MKVNNMHERKLLPRLSELLHDSRSFSYELCNRDWLLQSQQHAISKVYFPLTDGTEEYVYVCV